MVLFDEFSSWAIKKSLDLEDDDEAPPNPNNVSQQKIQAKNRTALLNQQDSQVYQVKPRYRLQRAAQEQPQQQQPSRFNSLTLLKSMVNEDYFKLASECVRPIEG